MFLKNTRPTIFELPDSVVMGPGATIPISKEKLESWEKNAAVRMYFRVGYLKVTDGDETAAAAVAAVQKAEETPPPAQPSEKEKLLAAISTAGLEALLKLAESTEYDPDVTNAINARAMQLDKGE